VVLVHGVVREGDVAVLDRLPGSARPVAAAGLAAVVSDAPDHELAGDDAVAHLDLLVAAVRDVPVLPFAFGTAVPDETAVRDEVLTPEADVLIQRLEAVADVVELRLDLTFDTDASVAAMSRTDPDVQRLAERARRPGAGLAERLALGEATAVRVAGHQEALADEWTGELLAVTERAALLHSDEQLRRTAYLVRRDRLDDADAAVERLRTRAHGLADVEYVGPLPVFSFLDDLDVEPDHTRSEPSSRWGW
jgi:hypothetical protein